MAASRGDFLVAESREDFLVVGADAVGAAPAVVRARYGPGRGEREGGTRS